jgi:enamine deaminase RidA (YjgF/YER057c/UK114 family)
VYIKRRFHASRIPHRHYLHNYSCGETLGGALPTSTTVEVRRLVHPDFLVEIEALAMTD